MIVKIFEVFNELIREEAGIKLHATPSNSAQALLTCNAIEPLHVDGLLDRKAHTGNRYESN